METSQELLKIIRKHQGITLTEIYKNSKKSYTTIQNTLRKLEKEGQITKKTEGRTKLLYTKEEKKNEVNCS